jgi:serine/threonine-protein kinase
MKSGHNVQARVFVRSVLGGMALVWLASGCGNASSEPAALGDLSQELHSGHGHGRHHPGGPGAGGDPGANNLGPVCSGAFLDQDVLFQRVNADLAQQDAEDRPFQRYLTLANRAGELGCGTGLDGERAALLKALNSVSIDARARGLLPVDADEELFRIDLRDYQWDRQIVVGGARFSDAWEALIAQSPYALEYAGDDADDAKAETGTTVPLLFSNALVAAVARAPLYYALLDLPADADDFLRDDLGIDVASGETARAGFSAEAQGGDANFLAQRFDVQVRAGVAWQISEFGDLFADPLGSADGEREIVFTLPNGLQGHILADANGRLRTTSNVLIDALERDGKAQIATSFLRSRAGGVQLEDEVRAFVRQNPGNFAAAERAAIRAAFPRQRELQQLLDADNAIFSAALQRIGLDIDASPEPVSQSFADFDADVDLAAAAGDLLVSPEDLSANIELLDPALSVLAGGGKVDRDDFSALYASSACILTIVLNNQVADCP